MKTLFFISVLAIAFISCNKQTACIGSDCVLTEAAVRVDSIIDERIYATLQSREGDRFVQELGISSLIDVNEFYAYAGYSASGSGGGKIVYTPADTVKVYYISNDQTYVKYNMEYVNASSTELDIAAFGDELTLRY